MKTIIAAAMVFATAWLAGQDSKPQKGIAGSWELTIKGPAAHGDLTATMDLEQNGKKVTGSFTAHGNTHNVAGEFANNELSLQTTDTPADNGITMNAKLADDGTLSGYLSSSMGDMKWTASRRRTVAQHVTQPFRAASQPNH
ncbi:MAG TPA: hypothetical protein VM791_02535 [Vicinamibacterales bacterium]|jgi:hypothetical protein|nr:hypothetical protein [Vicinamibacterales bacterium]